MVKYKEKYCLLCDKKYKPTSPKQKYCVSCKDTAMKIAQVKRDRIRNRKKYNILYNKICPCCGGAFKTYNSKKKYCGLEECNKYRISINSKRSHDKRSRIYMLEKAHKYYIANREKCLLKKAEQYRKNKPNAKNYVPGKINKHTIETIKNYIEERGYKLLSKRYKNNREKLLLECPKGHKWETTFHQFRDNGGNIGNRCATCYQKNNYVSKAEQLVRDFISNNFPDIKVEYNNRTIISPKELDLYFPDNNLAIEICGLYWHGELSSGKARDYHYNKMISCYEKNVRLITIFEDELKQHKEVVFSKIRQALKRTEIIILAEDCKVVEVDYIKANYFYNIYYLKGKFRATIRFGLKYKDKLIGIVSVIKNNSYTYTIVKGFCFLPNIYVKGGPEKLFEKVVNYTIKHSFINIKACCDMRYANIFNTIYDMLGFKLDGVFNYNSYYFKSGKRYNNSDLIKIRFSSEQKQYFDRIWDCGYRIYKYNLN